MRAIGPTTSRLGLSERDAGHRDQPVGRAQRADAAERRRVAQRAAGVGAERRVDQPGRDRDRRAAARAAGDPVAVPRVAARAPGRVLGRRAEAQLLEVGLGDDRPRRRRAGRATATLSTDAGGGCGGPSPSVRTVPATSMLSLTPIGPARAAGRVRRPRSRRALATHEDARAGRVARRDRREASSTALIATHQRARAAHLVARDHDRLVDPHPGRASSRSASDAHRDARRTPAPARSVSVHEPPQ